jgi:hypothetical protein
VVIFLLFLFLYVFLLWLESNGVPTPPTLADRIRFGRFSHGEAKSQHRAMSWELYVVTLRSGRRSLPGEGAASGQDR